MGKKLPKNTSTKPTKSTGRHPCNSYIANDDDLPWDRQTGESIKAFEAFCLYRDMGRARSYRKVAEELDLTDPLTIQNFANRYNWRERLDAWINHVDKIRQKTIINAIEDMNKRIASHAMAIETAIMAPVSDFLKRLKNNQHDLDEISSDNFRTQFEKRMSLIYRSAEAFGKVTDSERKARGQATEIIAADHTSNGKTVQVILPTIPTDIDNGIGNV